MRASRRSRYLVMVMLIAAVAVASVGGRAVASAGGRAVASAGGRAREAIVCPLATRNVVSCCGPVGVMLRGSIIPCCLYARPVQASCCQTAGAQPYCCPSNADCPATVTIAASPNPATVGQRVVIAGTRVGGGAGTQIALYQELAGAARFTQIATTTTDPSGAYRFTPNAVATDREWYVAAGGVRSPTVVESVAAVVTLRRAGGPGTRRTVALRGSVTPDHARGRLLIEQRVRGGWRVIARPVLDGRSAFAAVHAFARHGVVWLRAVLPADQRNLESFSRLMSLRV